MIKYSILLLMIGVLLVSCSDKSITGPGKQKFVASGSFSYRIKETTYTHTAPEGAAQCMIIGDSTLYFISVSASDSKENYDAQISELVFFGYTKSNKNGNFSLGSSDSTFRLGLYDHNGTAYTGKDGTITFTLFPSHAGDTLKGTISGIILNVNNSDSYPLSAEFSLICESFN